MRLSNLAAVGICAALAAAASAAEADGPQSPSKKSLSSLSSSEAEKSLSDKLQGLQFRNIGPFRGGRVTAVAGRARAAAHVLLRRHGRRRLEDDGRRLELGDRLRQVLQDGLRRRARRRSLRPERDLRRHGRRLHPRQHVGRRRRLEVDRRRQDVGVRRPRGHAADPARARPPGEPGPRLRRGARPHVGPEPRPRDLPLDGRRQDLEEGPLRRREDRRVRPRHGRDEPAHPLGGLLAGGPQAVVARERRPGRRRLEDHGRRRHVEEALGRPARGRRRPGRDRGLARAARARVGRSSKPRRAASSGRTTAARRGRSSTTRTSSGSGPGTTRTSSRTRRTRTPSTS